MYYFRLIKFCWTVISSTEYSTLKSKRQIKMPSLHLAAFVIPATDSETDSRNKIVSYMFFLSSIDLDIGCVYYAFFSRRS